MEYIIIYIQLLFIPTFSPLLVGLIRKLKAQFQNRRGASVLQPYADLWKLFQKDEVLSSDSSVISRLTPYIVFASILFAGCMIPVVLGAPVLTGMGDILVVLSLLMLATFFLALGGMDAGNAFGGLGSSREMTLVSFSEVALLCSLLPVALLVGSTNLGDMAMKGGEIGVDAAFVLIVGAVAYFIALLAENSRYPFDNPSTHLELTMIHEAMIIESSGKSLGLLEWSAANKLMLFLILFANIFLPWGVFSPDTFSELLLVLAVLIIKVLIGGGVIAMIESSIPKLRYFKLPELLFTSTALGIMAVVVAIM